MLRAGGNAVDGALAAMLMSFVTEALLTGLGAGGYMLVAGGDAEPCCSTSSCRRRAGAATAARPSCSRWTCPRRCRAGVLHGPASCGVYGNPAGVCAAAERWGSVPLSELAAPAARLAEQGVPLNAGQAYVAEILADLLTSTPECAALWAPSGHVLREGETMRNPDLGEALWRLGRDGPEPFYRGDVAGAVGDWLAARGGSLGAEDLAAYAAIEREPVRVRYRDREILTNPPPSAGGVLLAYSLGLLDRGPAPPTIQGTVDAMAAAQAERGADFMDGLADPGFLQSFMSSRLGSTTHISVIDPMAWPAP